MSPSIHTDDFQTLLDSLKENGYRCIAPVQNGPVTVYGPVVKADDIVLNTMLTIKSPKEFFQAEHETIHQALS